MEGREEHKYNVEATDCLIRAHMLNMQQYDMYLAQLMIMETGHNYMAVAFVMQLVQRFCLESADKATAGASQETLFHSDFFNSIETLANVVRVSRQCPEG